MIVNYIISLLALTVVIAFHELGHMVVAKLFKVKVEVFSVGMGKKFFKKQIGETEFALSVVPLGGYCKLKGGDPDSPNLDSDSMDAISPFKRAVIYFAGPFFNLLLSILFLSVMFVFPVNQELPPAILPVVGSNMPAEMSGLQKGDILTEINGNEISKFGDISDYLTEEVMEVTYIRDNNIQSLRLTPAIGANGPVIGVYPYIPLIVKNVYSSSLPIKTGDIIVAINNTEVDNYMDSSTIISDLDSFSVTVEQNGELNNYKLTTDEFSMLNFIESKSYNPIKSISMGITQSFDMLKTISSMFFGMFKTGEVTKTISSPLRLVYDVGNSLQGAYNTNSVLILFETFVMILSSISISLGFVNLLPIPVLDGGQILFNLIVLVKGSPLNKKVVMGYQTVGLIIVLLLFTLGISNDIFYFGDL